MTMDMAPNIHDVKKAEKVMEKSGEACKILKCNARCSVEEYNDECDGAGDVIQGLIERVLMAQRNDLERMDLVDTMAHSVPSECNYQYMPEVMFNETKDELSQMVIGDTKSVMKQVPDQVHLIRGKH